ncbi:hypothetical protein J3R82DRAFT_6952 [Butyriboletus roseoflavus]|nr:hypothetical protein J3R82DRAFT_6952 [Butyriboletus roseoflavus]
MPDFASRRVDGPNSSVFAEAMVISNIWSACSISLQPHKFIPERFLCDDGTLKSDDIENVGIRIRACVGRYFADMSVWSVTKSWPRSRSRKPGTRIGWKFPCNRDSPTALLYIHSRSGAISYLGYQGWMQRRLEQLIEATTT